MLPATQLSMCLVFWISCLLWRILPIMYCVQQLYNAYLQIFFKWKSKCHTPINGYDLLLKTLGIQSAYTSGQSSMTYGVWTYWSSLMQQLYGLFRGILIMSNVCLIWLERSLASLQECLGEEKNKIAVVLTWSLDFHKLVAAWMMILLAILMSSDCIQEQTNIYVPSFVQNKMEILFLHMLLPFRKLPCSSHTMLFHTLELPPQWNNHPPCFDSP